MIRHILANPNIRVLLVVQFMQCYILGYIGLKLIEESHYVDVKNKESIVIRYVFLLIIYYQTSSDWYSLSKSYYYLRRNLKIRFTGPNKGLSMRSNDFVIIGVFLIVIRLCVIIFVEICSYFMILTLPCEVLPDLLGLFQNFACILVIL